MDPVASLTTSGRGDRRRGWPANGRRAGLRLERPPQAPSSATTRPTRRCCWRRRWASRRARSPSGSASAEASGSATTVERVEVAGPGFLNLFMTDAWYRRRAGRAARARATTSARGEPARERMNVEFVSANPTGPITVASGRHAAYGDSLARILEFAGHEVEREYYVNDDGTPGAALRRVDPRARARRGAAGGRLPGRLRDASSRTRIDGAADADPDELARRGVELMLDEVARDARALPRAHGPLLLRARAARARRGRGGVLELLAEQGTSTSTRARPGCARPRSATTRTACCGARPASAPTSASDIAYHEDKLARGYDRAINVWGADHHGYIDRGCRPPGRRSAATRTASRS